MQSVRVPTNNYLILSGLKEFSKRMLKWFNIGFQLAPRIYKSIQTEKQANKIYEKDTLESTLILGHFLCLIFWRPISDSNWQSFKNHIPCKQNKAKQKETSKKQGKKYFISWQPYSQHKRTGSLSTAVKTETRQSKQYMYFGKTIFNWKADHRQISVQVPDRKYYGIYS